MQITDTRRLGEANASGLAVFFVLYLLLGAVGFSLRSTINDIALLWPPAGLVLTYLALAPRRRWPLIAVLAISADLLLDVAFTGTVSRLRDTAFPLINAGAAVAGAWALLTLVPQPWQRRQSIEIVAYVVMVALLIPMLGALVAAQTLYMSGTSLAVSVSEFAAWWLGDVLGIMLFGPIVGGLILHYAVEPLGHRRRLWPAIAVASITVALVILLLGLPVENTEPDLRFRITAAFAACFCALVWFALTQEPLVVASTSFVTSLAIAGSAVTSDSALALIIGGDRYLQQTVQVVLLTFSLSALLASLVQFERRHMQSLAVVRRQAGTLLANMASRLSEAGSDALDAALNSCLADIGRHTGADRARLVDFDYDRGYLVVRRSWLRPGVPVSELKLDEIAIDEVRHVVDEIERGNTVWMSRAELPAVSRSRELLERFGTRASGLAPMRRQGRVVGCIMLTWVRRNVRSNDELMTLLQATGQIIGNALNRRLAEAAEASYRDELRGLAADLNRLDDKVRRAAAVDLHDGAAQALAVARMKLAQLRSGTVETEATLTVVDELVAQALAEIRDIVDQMSPTALYELGIATALADYCGEIAARTGIHIEYAQPDSEPTLDGDDAIFVYRAARELVTNALKHAEAKTIKVRLWQTDAETLVDVEDDGIGMAMDSSPRRSRSGGLGLFSLTERLSHLGGWIAFDRLARGTRVRFAIPRQQA